MSKYSIFFTAEGLQDAKSLPKNVKNSLKKEIPERLTRDPIGNSLPLNPPLELYRSCHIGEYRVLIYLAEDIRAIAIAGIGKHSEEAKKDVYKKLETLVTRGQLVEKILATLRGFTHPRP